MRPLLAALLSAAPLVVAGRAPAAVSLSWQAPEGCPTRADVEARIAAALGVATAADTQVAVNAEAIVTKTGELYELQVVTLRNGVRGERKLADASCAALAEATAVIVALAADPLATAPPASEAPSSAPSPPPSASASAPKPSPSLVAAPPTGRPPTDTPADKAVRPPAPTSAEAPVSIAAFAGAGVIAGPLPVASPAFSLGAGIRKGAFRFDVEGRWAPGRRERFSALPDTEAGGTFSLLSLASSAWWSVLRNAAAFDFGPRLGIEAGLLRGAGFGVPVAIEGQSSWFAVEGGASASWGSRPFALRLDLLASLPFIRRGFVIEGLGEVHRPAVLGGRVVLTAELVF